MRTSWSKVTLPLGVAAALVGMIGIVSGGAVLAAKGGNGNNTVTIAFASPQTAVAESSPSIGDAVSFAVTANVKERDLYNLWVANKCSQDGVAVYAAYLPVHDGLAGPFTLDWAGGGAAECTAYVWMFPSSETPLRGGSMTYTAGP